jgi:hypothetical protein
MPTTKCNREPLIDPLLALRFDIAEAAQILRMSRAQLYNRIFEGMIKPQKDGARTYITRVELERYVDSCALSPRSERTSQQDPHRAST